MSIRRSKPYVCVDCDFADHHRFQSTKDLEASAGAWLRCLAYSRAQELDGIVKRSWVKRTFGKRKRRIDELIAVGLLRVREDGDYEIHAYAPRNQTRAMLDSARAERRDRITAWRVRRDQERAKRAVSTSGPTRDPNRSEVDSRPDGNRIETESRSRPPSRLSGASARNTPSENPNREEHIATPARSTEPPDGPPVTQQERVTSAFVPTSSSTSSSPSLLLNLNKRSEIQSGPEATDTRGGVQRGRPDAAALGFESASSPTPNAIEHETERRPLPPSERGASGPDWLAAFTTGISAATGRPCTAGRMYLGTLERIVEQHAPARDAPNACPWIRDQAKAFAKQWNGQFPAKGLTPDGLERWLNEGRQGPPIFGKPRTVQLPPEQWHDDDWSDLTDKDIQ
jgi:hypothetical protein